MEAKRSKTLAEELQEVAFVAPTRGVYRESGMEVIVHLEDFLEGEHKGAPLIRGDSELLEDLHTEGLQGFSLLKGPIELEGDAYQGQETSRNQLFEEDASLDGSVDERFNQATDSEGSSDFGERPPGDLYEAYNRLQSDVGLSDLKSRAEKDQLKGLAVQRDKRLWENCLELRVRLQKPLEASHQLPLEPYRTQLIESQQRIRDRYETLHFECRDALRDLLELEDVRLAGKRRKRDEEIKTDDIKSIWNVMEANYTALNAFCNASLDRFHRQAMLQSGATTKKGNLAMLHQGIASQVCKPNNPKESVRTIYWLQVQSMMQAPKKALMKSRILISEQPQVLGVPQSDQDAPMDSDAVNPEMFVDTELYQTLLNAYLVGHGLQSVPFTVISMTLDALNICDAAKEKKQSWDDKKEDEAHVQ